MRVLLLLIAGLMLVSPAGVRARGFSHTLPLGHGTVAVTNVQANSSWIPVAVMLRYETPADAVVAVVRQSQGNLHVLGIVSVTSASSVVWIPETDFPFSLGDVLKVQSTATNGHVQIIRRGD